MNIERAKQIEGWMTETELKFLARIAASSSNILEVGSFLGRSSRALADNTHGKLTCVDAWSDSYEEFDIHDEACRKIRQHGGDTILEQFEKNMEEPIKEGKVFIFRGLYKYFNSIEKYDFIFIDANHNYKKVKEDIRRSMELLQPNGIIAGHDYSALWSGVKLAVDELVPARFIHDTIWYKRI